MAANARVPGYVECFVKCLAMLSQMLHCHGMLKIQKVRTYELRKKYMLNVVAGECI